MGLSEDTEGIFISNNRYQLIKKRMSLKTATHKTRYFFEIYQHPITERYYITHDVNLACTHDDLILLSTEKFDIRYDKEKDKIYTGYKFSSSKFVAVDFIVCH